MVIIVKDVLIFFMANKVINVANVIKPRVKTGAPSCTKISFKTTRN
jgi:hypothetical protein